MTQQESAPAFTGADIYVQGDQPEVMPNRKSNNDWYWPLLSP